MKTEDYEELKEAMKDLGFSDLLKQSLKVIEAHNEDKLNANNDKQDTWPR